MGWTISNCVHYQIEWKVTLNNRAVKKDTEQGPALPPSCYWQKIKEEAADRLRREIASDRRVRLDDTSVVVSVNDSSQRDLTKNFEGTSIDWTIVEKQLLSWAHLYRLGKQLLLQILINYVEDNSSKVDKRGKSSVTKRMLGVRDAEIDVEQASGQQSIWRDVYRIMRCPGPLCRHEGHYSGQDPDGKKHYKLRSNHLKSLVKYVQQGGVMETHDDIPESLREQLYAEENQRLERQKKSSNNPASGLTCPPIHLHVLPSFSSHRF
ncbi:Short chain dehydrogenase/reductase family protein [Penicillium digitatum PHI26]|uniref:Short chain dehydrogenase/reductase family protein n=2 Tax=Penicillium digitatum TaxID=36651 RepID=K9G9S6_PEND2|nr:Short chain dehydrogenase/reductase family protein [Penicillium digitatum Pd1]EKV11632.1 Short chain dehydrogenase/reductase family protein [Penicillium digitatum Pd1]EKV16961.1 Short chain dehydrogenase/reductase family protein [Penicillium digitatum PHI26]EKV17817.1 Short chain dehydrogenase/reductase family protein [Penicillium digitatum PHI26]